MGCNCEGNKYLISCCTEQVLGPIENYYTKYQVDKLISGITVSGVTEEEMNEAISAATDGLASEEYVNNQISSQTADFVTGEELSSYTYDKATIDSKIASGGTFDPTQYYNKTATDELLAEKLDASAYTPTDLSNYYNKQEVDNKIASAKTEIEGEIPSLSGYATEQWVEDKHYITGVDLSNYSTTEQMNGAISAATSGLQPTLSAGTGIDITNNVISATGGGSTYYAGRAIDIDSGNTISFDLPISAGTGINALIYNHTGNTASGNYSHAEGRNSQANGIYSHAEGNNAVASGNASHAEGQNTVANSQDSHAEGYYSSAMTFASHAEGDHTVVNNDSEHASGYYNVSNTGSTDADKTLFSVGNGTADNRHNAFELRRNGDIYIVSGNTDIKLQDYLGGGVTSGEVQTMIDSSLSGYQEELTAGAGISISGNVISATGGSGVVTSIGFNYYSGISRFDLDYAKGNNFYKDEAFAIGDGLSVDENGGTPIISTTTKFWTGTKVEFDAITVKDNDTIYLVTN